MLDEQQDDSTAGDAPAGGVSAEDLLNVAGPPDLDGPNKAGPRAAAEERARHAAEHAAAKAAADAERRGQ
ncbi:MAG TPA: hypothetical protein VGO80_22220 [Solirubrobacteraceae bacterium]|jgi:hypothetical protein|nr:hypothetical protein [Solirubrobacteraceae bacterium]